MKAKRKIIKQFKHNKYVKRYDCLFTVGEISGWIVKPGKAKDVFYGCEEEIGMLLFKKFWDDLNFDSDTFLMGQFIVYPEYQRKNKSSEMHKILEKYMKKCKHILTFPAPLQVSDDINERLTTRNMPEISKDELEKAKTSLTKFYTKFGYIKYKDTELIIKEIK